MQEQAALQALVEQQRCELQNKEELIQELRLTIEDLVSKTSLQESTIKQQRAQLEVHLSALRVLQPRQKGNQLSAKEKAGIEARNPSHLLAVEISPPKGSANSQTTSTSLKEQLHQALADKAVLVSQLQRLVHDVASARADAQEHAEVSQRTLSIAWRIGELGHASLELMNDIGDLEDAPFS